MCVSVQFTCIVKFRICQGYMRVFSADLDVEVADTVNEFSVCSGVFLG